MRLIESPLLDLVLGYHFHASIQVMVANAPKPMNAPCHPPICMKTAAAGAPNAAPMILMPIILPKYLPRFFGDTKSDITPPLLGGSIPEPTPVTMRKANIVSKFADKVEAISPKATRPIPISAIGLLPYESEIGPTSGAIIAQPMKFADAN